MSDFFFKSPDKEIRHPNDDPNRKAKEAKGRQLLESGEVKFESEGHRKDYFRAVNSNPMNVPGLPEFYPPQVFKSVGFGEGKEAETLPCGHKWTRITYREDKDHKVTKIYQCKHGHDYPAEQIAFPIIERIVDAIRSFVQEYDTTPKEIRIGSNPFNIQQVNGFPVIVDKECPPNQIYIL